MQTCYALSFSNNIYLLQKNCDHLLQIFETFHPQKSDFNSAYFFHSWWWGFCGSVGSFFPISISISYMTLLSSFHFYQTQNTPTEGLKARDFISSGEGGEVERMCKIFSVLIPFALLDPAPPLFSFLLYLPHSLYLPHPLFLYLCSQSTQLGLASGWNWTQGLSVQGYYTALLV